MSNVTSAGVSRRFQSLKEAAGTAINMAEAVAQVLTQRLSMELQEGEIMPDMALVQKLAARCAARLNQELEESDHNRKHYKNIDRHRRVILNEAAAKLRNALIDVRYVLDRTLDKKVAKAAFEGRSNLTRLKSPVLERVCERMVSLLADPKFGWEQLIDSGYRTAVEASRLRLQAALSAFQQTENAGLPERDALVHALGRFEREDVEKGVWLRDLVRFLRGLFLGGGFAREADTLVLRRRKSPQPEEEPTNPEAPPAAVAPASAAPRPPAAGLAVAAGSGSSGPSPSAVAGLPALAAPAAPSVAHGRSRSEGRRKRHRPRRRPQKA